MRLRRGFVALVLAALASGCSAVSTADVGRSATVPTTSTSTSRSTTPTIAPPAPALVSPPRTSTAAPYVFVVGDSLTVGAEPWLGDAVRARGWRLTGVDARVGRTVTEGLAVLKRRARTLPPTVIVALGTNNLGASAADIEAWVATARRTVGDNRELGWVNLSVSDDTPRGERAREIDAALTTSAKRWNVQVLDWYGWSHRNGVTNKADGIHYEDGVYRLRALFYAAALPRVTVTGP